MGMLQEFKQFAMKGNVIDMAVGIIIGTAFGKIVSSLVNDVLMPPIGMLLGGINFTSLAITVGEGENAARLNYGTFIQSIVDFLIVAFAIFLMIKTLNRAQKLAFGGQTATPATPPPPPEDVVLLREIRDALQRR
jgi:large conductance mechanosensitive channel